MNQLGPKSVVADYHSVVRNEVLPLVPRAHRLLDVGCGTGATAAELKRIGRCDEIVGVEMHEGAAAEARKRMDLVIQLDVSEIDRALQDDKFDVILCLDILEHTSDPWTIVRNLSARLEPYGVLIASIPNIANVHALLPLILEDKWEYKSEGILDITHLRFFTRKSAIELVQSGGLVVDQIVSILDSGRRIALANLLTGGVFRRVFTRQYLIRGVRREEGDNKPRN